MLKDNGIGGLCFHDLRQMLRRYTPLRAEDLVAKLDVNILTTGTQVELQQSSSMLVSR
ncbi:MAG: hypothetical protein HYX63_10820 [Gammaproteobacteria bacterium]|nr:hypothetical protein [Gammaproteobacteria bacterium]